MAEADLMGVASHRVRMLPLIVTAIRDGWANPDPQLRLVRDYEAVCVLDGDRGLGRFVSVRGIERPLRGAAFWCRHLRGQPCVALGSCTCLCLSRRVAGDDRHLHHQCRSQHDRVGIAAAGRGNNPLAIGVPQGEGSDPLVLDMAMSQAAMGKIGTYLREGKTVPSGWGLDASGQPTGDPSAILSSGLLLPMGEHKGAGLALMMEFLTGALSGGLLSYEVYQVDSAGLDPEGSKSCSRSMSRSSSSRNASPNAWAPC